MDPRLGPALDLLLADLDVPGRLAVDPVAFPRRYSCLRDVEISALLSALLAFGRVAAIHRLLADLHTRMDARGGPAAWLDTFEDDFGPVERRAWVHRWVTGDDLALLLAGLRRLLEDRTLEAVFLEGAPAVPAVRPALHGFVTALRAAVAGEARVPFNALPLGLRHLLPTPGLPTPRGSDRASSACKRWNLLLRWLVRPGTEGIDLGRWTCLPPAALVIPLDTHVLRIGRLLGLTARADGSWRTAAEITASLACFCPEDPVRYDFALAHLGISGRCRRVRGPGDDGAEACDGCPLRPACGAVERG